MNEDSKMIYGIIESYIKAFPNNKDKLSLVFIDPSDLQPIIAAVHHYIQKYQKENGLEKELYINLDLDVYAPFTVTKKTDYIYFKLNGNNAQITIISPHLLLKYFFKNYKDYYYLPEEDITIHILK